MLVTYTIQYSMMKFTAMTNSNLKHKHIRYFFALFFCLLFLSNEINACTIFSCARKGEVFAAANEDDYTPFTRIWFNPGTTDRYGSVCFGGPDMQVASAMNEHGLFFDFAAASYDISTLNQTNPYPGFLMWDVLGKCKTVKEALVIIRQYNYNSPSQVLLADAQGASVLINPKEIVEKTGDFQVNANCNLINGKLSCRRPEIVNEMLTSSKENNVDLLKAVLDKTHQEGKLSTLYSTICDLKRGVVYVYFFHDYTTPYKINLKEELKKGYRIALLSNHFTPSFAYENFSRTHSLYRKEAMAQEMQQNGLKTTIDHYISENETAKDSTLPPALLEVGLQLIKYAFNQHNYGGMWDYWFSLPGGYEVTSFHDKQLDEAERLMKYLMDKQDKDLKLKNFITEIYAYLNLVKGDSQTAKRYYQKAIEHPEDSYPVSYSRSKEMLAHIR